MTAIRPAACWREVYFPSGTVHWQFHIPGYAVLGTVQEAVPGKFEGVREYLKESRWYWDARVMCDCTLSNGPGKGDSRCDGLALTLDGAKELVELALRHTGTYPLAPKSPSVSEVAVCDDGEDDDDA